MWAPLSPSALRLPPFRPRSRRRQANDEGPVAKGILLTTHDVAWVEEGAHKVGRPATEEEEHDHLVVLEANVPHVDGGDDEGGEGGEEVQVAQLIRQ